MLRGLALALLPGLLSAAGWNIDHATVAGTDVKAMQAKLQAIGFTIYYGGAHTTSPTEMALVSFPDGSYLELMGLRPNSPAAAVDQYVWGAFLKSDAGPCAWALRETNLTAEVERLRGTGVRVGQPVRGGRKRPDGVSLEWETSDIGSFRRGTFFPFLIQDVTLREQRAWPQGKPSTTDFKGIARVVIGVRNLDEAIAHYRQAYEFPAPVKEVDREFGAQLAQLSGTPVILAQPLSRESWLGRRIEQVGEAPCAFVLSAASAGRYRAASNSKWFGRVVSWFDESKLGWRLGFE